MPATIKDIRRWIKDAQEQNATHLIVVCDTFDWEDYYIAVKPGQDLQAVITAHDGPNMQKVMEIYDLSLDINTQITKRASPQTPDNPYLTINPFQKGPIMTRLQEKTGATLYIALDTPDLQSAQTIINDLGPHGYGIKLGLELCTAIGLPELLKHLDPQIPKFIDLKLNDIPNTVANTVRILSQMGAKIINLHASCGKKAMQAAANAKGDALLFAVTALTSLTDYDCECIYGATANKVVNRFAMMATDNGIDGIICSAQDLQNHNLPKTLMYLTPGIRPTWAATNDQARITTPHDAIKLGADGIVIGRPITDPPHGLTRTEALQKILTEIELTQTTP